MDAHETNSLIASRELFCKDHPEIRQSFGGREWGVLRVGRAGPALLLLPGTLGRADIFWQQIDLLKGRLQIVALSYPDSGGIEDWCNDICEIMDQNAIASATVLGSSLGGYLAQYFATVKAERVENLVAANTMANLDILSDLPPYNSDIDALPDGVLLDGFKNKLARAPRENLRKTELIQLLMAEIPKRIGVRELRARLKALQFGPQLIAQTLPKSRIFTVESGDDPLIPAPVRDDVRAYLQPSRSFYFEHGSHFPYVVEPEKYAELLREILKLG